MKVCAKCREPILTHGHRFGLFGETRQWELCCLCAGEVVAWLGGRDTAVGLHGLPSPKETGG